MPSNKPCCPKCIIDLDYKPAQCNNGECECHRENKCECKQFRTEGVCEHISTNYTVSPKKYIGNTNSAVNSDPVIEEISPLATPKNSGWEAIKNKYSQSGWFDNIWNIKELDKDIENLLQERSKDTVGELIEKLGDKFIVLGRADDGSEFFVTAKGEPMFPPKHTGSTPLEALQKLSEQLNQK